MNSRKWLVLLLAIVCLMAGCGKDKTPSDVTKATQSETQKETEKQTEKQTEAETEKTTEEETESETVTQSPDSEANKPEDNKATEFLYGCDVSTLIVQENSGVVYYNEEGNEQDALLTLAQNGVNMVRVRVWNDPYDENGNGYGGGNCDTDNAIAIGKRATQYGMTCMIDYHYSDFWADPSKQMCPKAWKDMSVNEKSEALYQYTKDSLSQILEAGVDVSVVQIGNETTSGMAGESDWKNIAKLMNSGSKAVRELAKQYDKDIMVAVHFTNPEKNGRYEWFAKTLDENNVDYDIFASSYYPFWHGTLDNLESVLGNIVEKYNKKVMVAEISYAHTYEDGDGHKNTIYDGAWGTFDYELSVESQVEVVKDCMETLKAIGDSAIGICYWEPAWIPVPDDTGKTRSEIWEEYGSGWASSYASGYDPKDAGQYYGGTAWDNQGWFDFTGHPLNSINTYDIIKEELK